ncbi:NACHT domain-containing protein [Bradyrhizobium lablabi]|uniref:NACHT domain-containing protein n=1 Tax=Bradyrhizobium lablabi TaxID=722472 RepID=A0A1M6PCD8_9BRAD|nr:NACHT domain-containing protein [Bradyrhizobium lablabi]SHK05606.1 NACHT domain-containing protein [Bradyrhizobium lablabi]
MAKFSAIGPRLIISIVLFAMTVLCSAAQVAEDPARKAFIQSVQERAQRDAKLGNPQEGIAGLNILFGNKAAQLGVTPLELLSTYEDAYEKAKSWSDFLGPKIGWIAAGAAFILGIFAAFLKDSVKELLQKWREQLYRRLAGHRWLRRKALRRYRKALIEKYQNIKIPFRPDQPLNMRELYVPLKLVGSSDVDQIAADRSVAEFKRLVAIGAPGSGKSMLLRSLALAYAEERLTGVPGNPIPILLELNRLNDSDTPLEEHLTKILELNDFPHGEDFVNAGLTEGRLLLMFDGLDEVNILRRPRVVKEIQDLLDQYESCRAIITCRNAVYNQEFVATVDATLELVEFNDQQIVRFLAAWKEKMRGDRSVEQLMRTLQDRPRIMALARNPLLLTVIAYMYTDTDFALPHNRAGFYEQSTNVLLGIWQQSSNRYRDAHKRLILQHLALFNQDRRGESGPGGRSIDLPTALAEVKKILPDLNIALDQAESVIEEIVERSGLLLAVDGGSQYQFAHLTIQEYFAAVALQNDQAGLFGRFQTDPNAWRETLMLWCGLGRDSSELIAKVSEIDAIAAFECLADAQKIKPEIADAIVNTFEAQLTGSDQMEEPVIRAFAAVAADARPRGVKTFQILQNNLAGHNVIAREHAASALSFTNLPKAAEVLSSHYIQNEWIRPKLVRLGNLAVPALAAHAANGSTAAVDDLSAVGTHEAIIQLIDLLWRIDNGSPYVAWQLAGMITRREFLEVMEHYSIPSHSGESERLDWIWRTDAGTSNAMTAVVGRIAYLLQKAPASSMPATANVSPYLFVPLLIDQQPQITSYLRQFVDAEIRKIPDFPERIPENAQMELLFSSELVEEDWMRSRSLHRVEYPHLRYGRLRKNEVVTDKGSDVGEKFEREFMTQRWAPLLLQVPKKIRLPFLLELVRMSPRPTPWHWRRIWQPFHYQFESSWHFLAVRLLWTLISLAALTEVPRLAVEAWPNKPVEMVIVSLTGICILCCIFLSWRGPDDYRSDDSEMFFLGNLLGFGAIPYATIADRDWGILKLSPYMVWAPGVLIFLALLIHRFADWPTVAVAMAAVFLPGLAISLRGLWLARLVRNPLTHVVELFQLTKPITG